MAIYYDDIKLMKSERLDDTPEGGGRMTGHEVVDGEMNNLFPDVSRLDRTYGRVNLRKAFPAVLSLTQDTYYGAHLIITRPPGDQKIKCALFTTKDSLDRRENAQAYIESYLDIAYRKPAYLVGAYPAGIAVIQVYQAPGEPGFRVNQVIVLEDYDNDGDPIPGTLEYARISAVEAYPSVEVNVRHYNGSDVVRIKVDKYILHLERGLQYDHIGTEPVNFFYPKHATYIFDTVVGASSKYYGISPLAEPASQGDLTVKVESIFTNIVPTARSEIALAYKDVSAQDGGLFPICEQRISFTVEVASGQTTRLPFPVIPGSVAGDFRDQPPSEEATTGDVYIGSTKVGEIDYFLGTISWTRSEGTKTFSFYPALNLNIFTYKAFEPITAESRRNTFVKTLLPYPTAPTVRFKFRAQGNWYELRDREGDGQLKGADPNFGSGVVDYTTGTVTATAGALPDLDSVVVWEWISVPNLVLPPATADAGLFYTLNCDEVLVENGVQVTYIANGNTYTLADDGNGNLTGDGEGKVHYQSGRILLFPSLIPDPDTDIVVTSTRYQPVISSGTFQDLVDDADPYWVFNANQAIRPGSVVVRYNVFLVRPMRRVVDPPVYAHDDGSGNLLNMFGDQVGSVNYSTGEIFISKSQPYHEYVTGELDTTVFSDESFWTGPRDTRQSQVYVPGKSVQTAVDLVANYFVASTSLRDGCRRVWTDRDDNVWFGTETCSSPVTRPLTAYLRVNTGMNAMFSYVPQDQSSSTQSYTFPSRPLFWAPPTPEGFPVPGTVSFKFAGDRYYLGSDEKLYKNFDLTTGEYGPQVGQISRQMLQFDDIPGGLTNDPPTEITAAFTLRSDTITSATFVVEVTPVIPGSFQLVFPDPSGTLQTVSADLTGHILHDYALGFIDYESGLVKVRFGKWEPHQTEYESEPWFDEALLNDDGTQVFVPYQVDITEVHYNAVAYKFIPLDPSILGLDPIRLPPDGRVPIFRVGDVIVIHNVQQTTLPDPVQAGQTYNLGRGNLAYVDIFDQDGRYVNRNLYTVDLEAGTVTFADPLDLSGHTQPLVAYHRREDMRLLSDVQINGELTFTEPLDYDYPTDGNSFVSSALLMGDLQARVLNVFDQKNWYGRFRDTLEGDPAEATYNLIDYPIEVTNKGAIQERWAIVFTSPSEFRVIGENVGVIATGNTAVDCAPINPATGEPYFRIRHEGWGTGWSTNNVLRFNTTAAHYPVWFARITLQGDPEGEGDSFKVQIRGDSD